MAGRGPAPKNASFRRNRTAPQRGEWTELPAVTVPVPPMPEDGEWSSRTERAWASWWSDPASTQWSVADKQLVSDLAFIYEIWANKPTGGREEEMRQRQDVLGLSPKGRQDRRWRLPSEIDDEDEEPEGEHSPVGIPDDELAKIRAQRAGERAAAN